MNSDMQIVNSTDNGPRGGVGQGAGMSFTDARRRHDLVTRKHTHAKEAGLLEGSLSDRSKAKVKAAAEALVDSWKYGRVTRAQIEEEQRADHNRLVGWKAMPPQPGTIHAEEPEKIKFRMAARERALETIAALDLATMIGSTGRNDRVSPKTPANKPWRAGAGHGSSAARAGGPISNRK